MMDLEKAPFFPTLLQITGRRTHYRPYALSFMTTLLLALHVYINPGSSRTPVSANTLPQRNPSYLIRARNGAVASENRRCSVIGVDVLKDGGNAVDAAIATTFCTGVVNMFS